MPAMTMRDYTEMLTSLGYRMAIWAVEHLIDDPAMLAVAFC